LLYANYLEEMLPRLRDEYGKRRDAMLESLAHHFTADASWTRPDGGMFVFMTLPNHLNATTLLPRALDKKVAYVPGEEFHLNGQGKNTLRLNFSNASPEKIAEGIERMSLIFAERSK
jgi:2-aminoadipate transaminase